MDKKGVLQLTVEIDYDQMITEDKLEALQDFTGEQTEEGVAKAHVNNLGMKLSEMLRDLPHVKYELSGGLFPVREEKEMKSDLDTVREFDKIVREIDPTQAIREDFLKKEDEGKEEDRPTSEGYTSMFDDIRKEIKQEMDDSAKTSGEDQNDKPIDYEYPEVNSVKDLDVSLRYVSKELGIPQEIKANEPMLDKILGENDLPATYDGFPLQKEGMEDSFIIRYKSYRSNEIEEFSSMELNKSIDD